MPKKHKKSAGQRAAEHDAAVDDIVNHFAQTYISNDRLAAFQQLCRDLDVEVGSGIKKCKENIKRAYVNIHDFVRVQKAGGDVSKIKFRSYFALKNNICSHWTRRFPLHRAKGDELLTAMLITL